MWTKERGGMFGFNYVESKELTYQIYGKYGSCWSPTGLLLPAHFFYLQEWLIRNKKLLFGM